MKTNCKKIWKVAKIGLKLGLIVTLAGIIAWIPQAILAGAFVANPLLGIILIVPYIIVIFWILGWALLKWKNWIFK